MTKITLANGRVFDMVRLVTYAPETPWLREDVSSAVRALGADGYINAIKALTPPPGDNTGEGDGL